ncbi:enoyl-CoA hydratase/isomerase family protein [Rhodobacteraceae bacterium]|nr:enoyl-CoA hydratase/isomerase family protein [Paracoccaceae bacterium]
MIEVSTTSGLCILTLNRPKKANALTAEMLVALRDAVVKANGDSDLRALVFTGVGKVFSAGADLEAAKGGLAVDPLWEEFSGAVADSPLLTIAALNGTVAGGAMGMVLACDLRLAVPSAKAFYPVMKLGFLPQPSDPLRLAALVGPARAKLILMAGQKIDAPEALAMGLFDRISDDPMAKARILAADALDADRAHVSAIKGMVTGSA